MWHYLPCDIGFIWHYVASCDIVLYAALASMWHWLPYDTGFHVTLASMWHWLPCDTGFHVTLASMWHWLPCDIDFHVTVASMWHWLPCDIGFQAILTPMHRYFPRTRASVRHWNPPYPRDIGFELSMFPKPCPIMIHQGSLWVPTFFNDSICFLCYEEHIITSSNPRPPTPKTRLNVNL